jgi:hypothetical protein
VSLTEQHVYRVDYTSNLLAIPDDCQRAPRWRGGSKSYPHSFLKSRLEHLSDARAIYRICFWSSLELAVKDSKNYRKGPTTIAGCLKDDVLAAGFNQSGDDGLPVGQAYLFWIEEQLNEHNQKFSRSLIPFDRFVAFVEGGRIPLAEHLAPAMPSVVSHTTHVESESRFSLRSWIKSIF